MTTYTDAIGFNKGQVCYPAFGHQRATFVEVVIDLPAIVAARVEAEVDALAANDILEVIPVPAGTYVLNAGIDVTTVEGEAGTLDLGDGTDGDGLLDGVDYNAVAHYVSTNGRLFTVDDTIDVTFLTATPTLAVFRVWAWMLDTNAQGG